jgi:predicted Zn-dependent protease
MKEKTFAEFGTLTIDCSSLEPFLIDLPIGGRVGLKTEQPGLDLAVAEIMANQANHGDKAGVTALDVQLLRDTSKKIDSIDEQLPAVRKLLEVLEETRAVLDDQRNRQVSAIASAVENRAKIHRDDGLLAKYENTRTYRSASGHKAARTRRRNLAIQAQQAAGQAEATKTNA